MSLALSVTRSEQNKEKNQGPVLKKRVHGGRLYAVFFAGGGVR